MECRPSNRPGETSGDFYPVPHTEKEVKKWRDFFTKRRESVDKSELYGEHEGTIVLMTVTLAKDTLNGYRTTYTEEQRGAIPETFDSKTTKALLVEMAIDARRKLRSAGINLSTAFRAIFPVPAGASYSPVADAPPDVSLAFWPNLDDRGDGVSGSPLDHELVSFPVAALDELTTDGDVKYCRGVGEDNGGAMHVAAADDRRSSAESSFSAFLSQDSFQGPAAQVMGEQGEL